MKNICFCTLILSLSVCFLSAQTSVKGKVIDKTTSEPIEFSNVIALKKSD
jgi:hypothetical protein